MAPRASRLWASIVVVLTSAACSPEPTFPPPPTFATTAAPSSPTTGSTGTTVAVTTTVPVTTTAISPSLPTGLVQPDDLTYRGAFRLPGGPEDSGWAWSGAALTHSADGDHGDPGSLFGTGHDHFQWVSEISIPVPVISSDLSDLPTAGTLQSFADIRGGLFDFDRFEIPRAALEAIDGRIHFAWGQHLEGDGEPATHGAASSDLSTSAVSGPWRIDGAPAYATNDYLFVVDETWSAMHLGPGIHLATGRFRDGGWSGMGPSLYAYEVPGGNTPPDTALPAQPFIQYATSHDGDDGPTLDGYHHSDEWTGGAWLATGTSSAVVFVGTKGFGDCWYGFENGVVWPDGGPYPEVPAAPFDARGWWSSSFEAIILFYDPADLAAVVSGGTPAHEPQPYAVMSIDNRLLAERRPTTPGRIGGVAYDRDGGTLYIQELHADGAQPVIHVWSIGA